MGTKIVNGEVLPTTAQDDANLSAERTAHALRVPRFVTRYQFKQALLDTNRYQDAVTAINSATAAQKLEWAESQNVRRNGGLIAHLKTALSLTDAQIDAFFRNAASIED